MSKQSYSKAKGNGWENTVFRDLRAITNAYKSIGSGNGLDSGDILTNCFCIECKFHKTFTENELDKYWLKVTKEAEENKREPILIYKQNNKRPRVRFYDQYRGTRTVEMEYETWLEYLRENTTK